MREANPVCTVEDLQKMLKAVGIYSYKIDGDFGKKSEKSLKLFQWACANIKAYVKCGVRNSRTLSANITLSGKLNKQTYNELLLWDENEKITTGDLVRVPFNSFSNVEAGSGFKKVASTEVCTGEAIISKGAVQLLKDIAEKAKTKDVIIKVNQVLRISGVKVTGAVVPPATKSQHLIGHALDCNIVDGTNWNNSKTFKEGDESTSAKEIISELKIAGYRWGGDFNKVDIPHFDKQILSIKFDYDAKFFFNQRMISLNQPIPMEII